MVVVRRTIVNYCKLNVPLDGAVRVSGTPNDGTTDAKVFKLRHFQHKIENFSPIVIITSNCVKSVMLPVLCFNS